MTILDSIVLGVVEGLTEFLPVSSTGHLILAGNVLGIPETEFLKSFDIAIQLGAILAVVALYFRPLLDIEMLKRLVVAFIPTGVAGFTLYPFIKTYLLGNEAVVLGALFLGGIALIAFEMLHRESDIPEEALESMSFKQAFLIGVFQAVAIVPGVSRSAATILGGLLLGMKRIAIVEFSFLLAVPTMAAATGYDLLKNAGAFSGSDLSVLAVGFITSFIVALFAIKFLLAFVRTHSFIPFGIYRILLAALFFAFLL